MKPVIFIGQKKGRVISILKSEYKDQFEYDNNQVSIDCGIKLIFEKNKLAHICKS